MTAHGAEPIRGGVAAPEAGPGPRVGSLPPELLCARRAIEDLDAAIERSRRVLQRTAELLDAISRPSCDACGERGARVRGYEWLGADVSLCARCARGGEEC